MRYIDICRTGMDNTGDEMQARVRWESKWPRNRIVEAYVLINENVWRVLALFFFQLLSQREKKNAPANTTSFNGFL